MTGRMRVITAGPMVSFQDTGRPGLMRYGIPTSGPMDRLSHTTANLAVGNDADATAIEISLGGLTVEVLDGPITIAIAGGRFTVRHNDASLASWVVSTLEVGDRLSVQSGEWGSWAVLAVAGRLRAATWLGRTSTHSMSRFGGGFLAAADELAIDDPRHDRGLDGPLEIPPFARPSDQLPAVLGPQDQLFEPSMVETLLSAGYRISAFDDRMGSRLEGPHLSPTDALSIPSEPILRGAIQVAGDGVPVILHADHQTTGGYPKIATIASAHLDRAAQLRPDDPVHFERMTPAAAVEQARDHAARVASFLGATASDSRTLTQRLRRNNLIGGAHEPEG